MEQSIPTILNRLKKIKGDNSMDKNIIEMKKQIRKVIELLE